MRQLITTPAQVAEILRGRRKSRKLPQAEVAAKLGISQGRLSVLESDPAGLTLERFLVLARLLGLEVVVQDRSESPAKKDAW
jgi:HTH-type transcriptional regulator/antitoxin HipB